MGASWLTTLFGSGAIIGAFVQLIMMTIEENGLPHDASTWMNFITKIVVWVGLILSKSYNVSNSPTPAAATVVPDAAATKPNPAATQG
jgi:uncharacterized membrane protein